MEKAIEEISTMKLKNSHLEDLALKTAAQYFGEELLPYLKIKGKFKAIAPTELIRLDVSQMLQDFNYVMQDGSWSHFEFQSTNGGLKDLRRFREYEAVTSRQYQVAVTTYVIFSGKIKNPVSSITEGINTYHIHPITLRSSDADRIIESLKILNTMNERKENREDLQKIQSVLYAFAVKMLDKVELKEIEEVMSMTILGEMLIERGKAKSILELLDEYQPIPAPINEKIMNERNSELLSRWLKTAAKSTSLKDFIQSM